MVVLAERSELPIPLNRKRLGRKRNTKRLNKYGIIVQLSRRNLSYSILTNDSLLFTYFQTNNHIYTFTSLVAGFFSVFVGVTFFPFTPPTAFFLLETRITK